MSIWQISPFRGGYENDIDNWKACVKNGVISIWWDKEDFRNYKVDLRNYNSKTELAKALRKKLNSNDVRSCWAFCRRISKGDIIVAKKGGKDGGIYGIGRVLNAYEFIDNPPEKLGKHIIRVKWEKTFAELHKIGMNFYIPTVGLLNDEKYEKIQKLLGESKNSQDIVEHEPSEIEIRKAEDEIEQLSNEPFKLTEPQKFVTTSKKSRDAGFSRKIINLYNGKCAICEQRWEIDESFEAEAAHIVPKEKNGTDDIRNGIVLCKFHHWIFDKGVFSIDDDYRITVSPKVKQFSESFITVKQLEGNSVNIPKEENLRPHKDALRYHRDNIFIK